MNYETPELRALTTAISAIQGPGSTIEKTDDSTNDSAFPTHEVPNPGAYADWE